MSHGGSTPGTFTWSKSIDTIRRRSPGTLSETQSSLHWLRQASRGCLTFNVGRTFVLTENGVPTAKSLSGPAKWRLRLAAGVSSSLRAMDSVQPHLGHRLRSANTLSATTGHFPIVWAGLDVRPSPIRETGTTTSRPNVLGSVAPDLAFLDRNCDQHPLASAGPFLR